MFRLSSVVCVAGVNCALLTSNTYNFGADPATGTTIAGNPAGFQSYPTGPSQGQWDTIFGGDLLFTPPGGYVFENGFATSGAQNAVPADQTGPGINGLTVGTSYVLEFTVHLYNEWQGNTTNMNDYFSVTLTPTAKPAVKVFNYTFSNDPFVMAPALQSYPNRASQSAGTMLNLPTGASDDDQYSNAGFPANAKYTGFFDSTYTIQIPFVAQATTTQVTYASARIKSDGTTDATFAPYWRVMSAEVKDVTECNMIYSFTDSNQLTSYYCNQFTTQIESNTCTVVPDPIHFWTQISSTDAQNGTCPK